MTPPGLIAILTTDLVAITRGRSVSAEEDGWRTAGIGWVPANAALDPFGAIAPNPFGPNGDLRLMPDSATEVHLAGIANRPDLHFVLGDLVDLHGAPWSCCPRGLLRAAVRDLAASGLQLTVAFEQEFTLLDQVEHAAPPFSLMAHRRAEPLLSELFAALDEAGARPESILPEYGAGQFEITCAPTDALAAADRAVTIREVARDLAGAAGRRISFAPKPAADGVGNGVHIHMSLRDLSGRPTMRDPARPGGLSAQAGAFAAGVLRLMAPLCAFTAPTPVSYLRLVPHHWSAAYACLGERNREAALRICPLPAAAADPDGSFNVEYRPADATANPYLALTALVRAGLSGVRAALPAPPLVQRDPADLTEDERVALGAARLPESLPGALAALKGSPEVSGWFDPIFMETFRSVKLQEATHAAGLSAAELCRRYTAIY